MHAAKLGFGTCLAAVIKYFVKKKCSVSVIVMTSV